MRSRYYLQALTIYDVARRAGAWICVFACAFFSINNAASAAVSLPDVFADGMVLQCREKCPVWGKAAEGEKVTVSFREQSVTVAAKDGQWRVDLDAGAAGGPFTLVVHGDNKIEIRDVYVGEVWIVSGQSNIKHSSNYKPPQDAPEDVRFYLTGEMTPKEGGSKWIASGWVPVMAWHFGQKIRQLHKVPVGIICCAYSGTSVEQWKPGPDPTAHKAGPGGGLDNDHPGGLYYRWVAPLQPYGIKGVIWWQGESNAKNAEDYLPKFTRLIEDWRQAWHRGNFPFIWIQLQRIDRTGPDWQLEIADGRSPVADAQRRALSLPNTAMATTYDITVGDLHPPEAEKRLIAERLVLAADALAYGKKEEWCGPLPDKATRRGDDIVVTFTHAEGGLKVRANLTTKAQDLCGFQIQGAGGQPVPAKARIENGAVVIAAQGLKAPLVVRYAWGPQPEANLYNGADLPAPTFALDPIP